MKELKTFEDFEDSLKRISIPEFDENLIINHINTVKSKRYVRFKIKTIVLVTVLFILTISSIVYGKNFFKPVIRLYYNVISSISLSDKDGRVLFEYQKVEYNDDFYYESDKLQSIYKKYSYIMYKHEKMLKDNESELFVVVDAYKINGSIRFLHNDKRFNSLDDLIESSSVEFKTPNILPEKYYFKYGYIKKHHAVDKNLGAVADELYNKALKEGKDYITLKFKTTYEISEIYLNYAENYRKNNIEIQISSGFNKFGGNSTNVELIDINGHEALYISSESGDTREIIFTDNNGTENLTYRVVFHSPPGLGKDMYPHIIDMIESMFE